MREIKFRAWDKSRKEMKVLRRLSFPLEEEVFCVGVKKDKKTTLHNPMKIMELMQFTGLHDKNGREIYEKDIIKRFSNDGMIPDTFAVNSIFEYNKMNSLSLLTQHEKVKVIGNVFEHNHLLEE